jgi:hypothetical protein
VLLKRRGGGSAPSNMKQLALFDQGWKDAAEKAKKNRTVFAQRRLKPEEVLPSGISRSPRLAGTRTSSASPAAPWPGSVPGSKRLRRGFKAPLGALPEDVRERLESEGLTGAVLIDFTYPPAARCRSVQRSHPLISVLAETLLERTLASVIDEVDNDPGVLGRVGCWTSAEVTARTVVALLRLRHQLVSQRSGRTSTLLVEEATALAWTGSEVTPLEGAEALALLAPPRRPTRRATSASVRSSRRSRSSKHASPSWTRSQSVAPRPCSLTTAGCVRPPMHAAATV